MTELKQIAVALGLLAFSAGAIAGDSAPKQPDTKAPLKAESREDSTMTSDYRTIPFKTITGHDSTLKAFDGKVLLIVNVASECGYTKQYAGLEELYEKYKAKGLVVVGFPANNFGGQEPGSDKQILEFCTSKFAVTFPMMSKVSVLGDDKHPLFRYLTEQSPQPGEIKWNFGKFLLDRQGKLVARFDSGVEPLDKNLTSQIESLL